MKTVMTREQVAFHKDNVKRLFTYSAYKTQVHSSDPTDRIGLSSIIETNQMLWIIHPSTRKYVKSKVQKIKDYLWNMERSLVGNEEDRYILKQLWDFHNFFIYLIAPRNVEDIVENQLISGHYQKAHTKRDHFESDIFSFLMVTHTPSGFIRSIIVPGNYEQITPELIEKLNRSLAASLRNWNRDPQKRYFQLEYQKDFYVSKNISVCCTHTVNRKQKNSATKHIGDFNLQEMEKHYRIFLCTKS